MFSLPDLSKLNLHNTGVKYLTRKHIQNAIRSLNEQKDTVNELIRERRALLDDATLTKRSRLSNQIKGLEKKPEIYDETIDQIEKNELLLITSNESGMNPYDTLKAVIADYQELCPLLKSMDRSDQPDGIAETVLTMQPLINTWITIMNATLPRKEEHMDTLDVDSVIPNKCAHAYESLQNMQMFIDFFDGITILLEPYKTAPIVENIIQIMTSIDIKKLMHLFSQREQYVIKRSGHDSNILGKVMELFISLNGLHKKVRYDISKATMSALFHPAYIRYIDMLFTKIVKQMEIHIKTWETIEFQYYKVGTLPRKQWNLHDESKNDNTQYDYDHYYTLFDQMSNVCDDIFKEVYTIALKRLHKDVITSMTKLEASVQQIKQHIMSAKNSPREDVMDEEPPRTPGAASSSSAALSTPSSPEVMGEEPPQTSGADSS